VRQLAAGAARRAWDPPRGLSKRIETRLSRVSARVLARKLVRRVYQTHADPGAAGRAVGRCESRASAAEVVSVKRAEPARRARGQMNETRNLNDRSSSASGYDDV